MAKIREIDSALCWPTWEAKGDNPCGGFGNRLKKKRNHKCPGSENSLLKDSHPKKKKKITKIFIAALFLRAKYKKQSKCLFLGDRLMNYSTHNRGFLGGSVKKNLPVDAGDLG